MIPEVHLEKTEGSPKSITIKTATSTGDKEVTRVHIKREDMNIQLITKSIKGTNPEIDQEEESIRVQEARGVTEAIDVIEVSQDQNTDLSPKHLVQDQRQDNIIDSRLESIWTGDTK